MNFKQETFPPLIFKLKLFFFFLHSLLKLIGKVAAVKKSSGGWRILILFFTTFKFQTFETFSLFYVGVFQCYCLLVAQKNMNFFSFCLYVNVNFYDINKHERAVETPW